MDVGTIIMIIFGAVWFAVMALWLIANMIVWVAQWFWDGGPGIPSGSPGYWSE